MSASLVGSEMCIRDRWKRYAEATEVQDRTTIEGKEIMLVEAAAYYIRAGRGALLLDFGSR
eukprot:1691711-Alexandrium_andersonii.AAC.1